MFELGLDPRPASFVQIPGAAGMRDAVAPNIADEHSNRKTKDQDCIDPEIEHGARIHESHAPPKPTFRIAQIWRRHSQNEVAALT